MSYWILQVNPNAFKLSLEVQYQCGQDDWWCLSRARKIQEGETAYIWRSIDYRRSSSSPAPRGIYAKAIVLSVPRHSQTNKRRILEAQRRDAGRWNEPNEKHKQESKPFDILVSYQATWENDPLTIDEIRNVGLVDLQIISFPKLEICSVSATQAARLEELLEHKQQG